MTGSFVTRRVPVTSRESARMLCLFDDDNSADGDREETNTNNCWLSSSKSRHRVWKQWIIMFVHSLE